MRAVLDANVIISALISPRGAPAELLRRWEAGAFEMIVSPTLLAEVERALGYPKVRKLVDSGDAQVVLRRIRESAVLAADPPPAPALRSADPADDYLLALSAARGAALVSGDEDLLRLTEAAPVYSPAAFLILLDALEERA